MTSHRLAFLFGAVTACLITFNARSQTPVFNETWAEGNRTTQNPPTSLQWFASSNGAPASTVAGGTCTFAGGRSLTAYFPTQTIAVGGALTLTFNFSLTGPVAGSKDLAGFATGLRWGIFSSGGAAGNIFTADGQNGNVTSTGYLATVETNPTAGELGATGLKLVKRFALANTLVTTTGTTAVLSAGSLPGPAPLNAASTYTCVMTLQSLSAGDLLVTYTITGPGLPFGYTASFEDTGIAAAPAGAPAAPTPFASFDTISFNVASSGGTNAAASMSLGRVSLVYSAPGSAGTITAQPSSQVINAGGSATFAVTAAGTGNSYQWMFNGNPVAGATGATLSLAGVQAFNAGGYTVAVTNAGLTLVSNRASLVVNPSGTAALNPTFVPGKNFSLSGWTLQLPVSAADPNGLLSLDTSVTQVTGSGLATYTSTYFYTDTDGAMRFYAPITGDRLGSDYPRSELREQYTPTQADWFDTYGTAIMNASLRVAQAPVGTTKITIGQIKADSALVSGINIMTELFYDSTRVYANVNYGSLVDAPVQVIFPNGGAPGSNLVNYQLKMVPGAVFVTINGTTQAVVLDQSATTGWAQAPVYFKAGAYVQANPSTEGANPPANDGGSTAFTSLNISHLTSSLSVATTTSLPSAPVGFSYSQTLQAANASGAVTWSLVRGVIGVTGGGSIPIGSLPPGLAMSSAGVISGTPQATDVYNTYGNIVVAATDAAGATAIQTLSLQVTAFTTQPASQTIQAGSTVVFSAAAAGSPTYQWQFNGTNIAGATKSQLVVPSAQAANAGAYTVVATDASGAMTSAPATLTIASATNDPGRLINLSVLTDISAAVPNFIVAAVIGGGSNGTKPLVVRAAGPALGALGFPATIPDPQLSLFNSSSVSIAANDNWGGGAALANAMSSVGAFAFPSTTSLDAAVNATGLVPGNYSVIVSGTSGSTGNVIAEIYDATPASAFTSSSPRLINVSVNKQISAGGLLTLGFTLGGSAAKTVLIRAIGPGLVQFGYPGSAVLADPKLTLFNSSSTAIASNDDWGADPQLVGVLTRVNAFSVGAGATKDAMLLVTLPPGGYTAQATGNCGTGGAAIVEVYEVP